MIMNIFKLSIIRAGRYKLIKMSSTYTTSNGVKIRYPGLPASLKEKFVPGKMYKYQNDVQRLPVMPLKHILDNYLLSVQPLMSNQEMTKTRQVVEEFGKAGGIGEMLHKKLVERSQTHESWLADWWNHYAYLAFRDPVTVNVTPGIAYPHIPCGSRDEYIQTAAKLVSITGRFLMLVLTESVPPETYQGKPFCMSQYVRAGCRIPGKSVDTFRQNSITDKRHMIFFRKGNLYTLDVFYETSDGVIDLVPAAHIAKQIKWILEDGNDPNPHPVSVMTTGQRDDWYEARERLREDPINRESCDIIENSVYCICLDEPHPKLSVVNKEYSEEQAAVVALRSLHGNGLRYNLVNRWFDATSHIFIGEDGGCGTILEHSAMDGVVGIATNQFAMDFVKSGYDVFAEVSDVDPSLLKPARPLKWNLSTDTLKDIEKAKNNVDKLTQNVDFHTIKFNNFGKKLLKNFKVSPDGFMQSAIQWTYYKMYGRMGAIYESGSIRWFKYGRTDTIRSCTNASHAFAVAMQNTKKSAAEKCDALVESIKAHKDYSVMAMSGKGIDRHLLGLKILSNDMGIDTPDIFKDLAYERSTHFVLSTSQVPVQDHDIFLCFGAVVPDGYGICYNPQENRFIISISSFHECSETDSMLFAKKLRESLMEMKEVLLMGNMPKNKL